MTKEEIDQPNRSYVRDYPGRKEALLMLTQHKEFGSSMWHAFIESKDGKRQIGEWTKFPGEPKGGRFLNLVPPDGVLSNPVAVAAARTIATSMSAAGNIQPIDKFIELLRKEAE